MPSGCRFSLVFVLVALALALGVHGWTHGDVVPLLVELKVNQTHVTQRYIPHSLNPRFGIDHVVKINSLDYDPEFSNVKMRVELGRGLKRRTTWIKLRQGNRYLERLQLKFKYRYNVFGKFEKFTFIETHSNEPRPWVTFEYTWTEERMFNPHGTITFLSAVSLLLVVVLMVRMTTAAFARGGSRSFVVHEKAE